MHIPIGTPSDLIVYLISDYYQVLLSQYKSRNIYREIREIQLLQPSQYTLKYFYLYLSMSVCTSIGRTGGDTSKC